MKIDFRCVLPRTTAGTQVRVRVTVAVVHIVGRPLTSQLRAACCATSSSTYPKGQCIPIEKARSWRLVGVGRMGASHVQLQAIIVHGLSGVAVVQELRTHLNWMFALRT